MAGHALNAVPSRSNSSGANVPNRMPGPLRYALAIATALAVVTFTFVYFALG